MFVGCSLGASVVSMPDKALNQWDITGRRGVDFNGCDPLSDRTSHAHTPLGLAAIDQTRTGRLPAGDSSTENLKAPIRHVMAFCAFYRTEAPLMRYAHQFPEKVGDAELCSFVT